MRIALVTGGMSPYAMGGMQRHSRMLAESLARVGVDVTVFHTAFDAARVPAASALGLPARTSRPDLSRAYPVPASGSPSRSLPGMVVAFLGGAPAPLRRSWRARGLHLRARPDRPGTPSPARAAHGPSPIGVNAHGHEMFRRTADFRGVPWRALLRPAFRDVNIRADVALSFSGRIRRIVEQRVGVPADRIAETPNGIEESWLVATDVGATAEMVDSSNGILLAGPEPVAIADAMRRVISMYASEVMQYKSRSLARACSYGWQQVARRVIDVADRAMRRLAPDRRTAA